MAFGHPKQKGHMLAGLEKALRSRETPLHLLPHIQTRVNNLKNKPQSPAKRHLKPGNDTPVVVKASKKLPLMFGGND